MNLCYDGTMDKQSITTRLREDEAVGCGRVYQEQVTGARADWRELLKMRKTLASGDVVTVARIDRLSRSTFDLFAIGKQIVDAGAQFRSLAEPWADIRTITGRLMFAVLGGLADSSATLSERAPPKDGRGRRRAASIWADLRSSPRSSRRRRDRGGQKVRRPRNWRSATTSGGRRFRGGGRWGGCAMAVRDGGCHPCADRQS